MAKAHSAYVTLRFNDDSIVLSNNDVRTVVCALLRYRTEQRYRVEAARATGNEEHATRREHGVKNATRILAFLGEAGWSIARDHREVPAKAVAKAVATP